MSEKFSLKWNDFQTNALRTFSSLRAENDFFDVTLVCDDQKQISAHKLVLSSCSEYFKNILKQNNHSHPLLCLADMNYDDLTNVLDYIYHGEAQIYQENLDRFLLIAQRLKLNGMLTNQTNEKNHETDSRNSDEDFSIEVPETKIEVIEETKLDSQEYGSVSIPEDSSMDDVKRKVLEYLEKGENGQCRCKLCGKVTTGVNRVQNMQKHIESHLEGLSFPCRECGKQFKRSNSLNAHKATHRTR